MALMDARPRLRAMHLATPNSVGLQSLDNYFPVCIKKGSPDLVYFRFSGSPVFRRLSKMALRLFFFNFWFQVSRSPEDYQKWLSDLFFNFWCQVSRGLVARWFCLGSGWFVCLFVCLFARLSCLPCLRFVCLFFCLLRCSSTFS